MKPKVLNLQWPTGGISRRYGFQSQPPYTTPFARNVWINPDGRMRGGSRPGLARAFTTQLGKPLCIETVSYVPSNTSLPVSQAVIIGSNGQLYAGGASGSALTQVTSIAVSPTYTLRAAERGQKLYIAAHSQNQSESSSSYVPYVYDPTAGTVSALTATDGTIPYGSTNICVWRDRLVLAGGTTTPFGVFMSRQGDFTDWDYAEEDSGAAVNLTLAEAGQIGDMVTAMHPHADNCLIIGCSTSLWMMQGDPGYGYGSGIRNLSYGIGVVDKNSWCVTPDGWFVFLSREGLYGVPAECGNAAKPVPLSKSKVPEDLLVAVGTAETTPIGVSSADYVVSMAYDLKSNGFYIFKTLRGSANNDASGVHWYFDWETKSLWDFTFPAAKFEPWTCHARRNFVSDKSFVLLGCRDGYVRRFDSGNVKDDQDETTEANFDSHILIGPILDSSLQSNVRLDQLQTILARTSGPVRWEIYTGNSSEEAAHKAENGISAAASGLSLANAGFRSYPRVSAPAMFIRLSNAGCEAWEFESMAAVLSPAGAMRV